MTKNSCCMSPKKSRSAADSGQPTFFAQLWQPGITSCPVRINRMPPAPFRPRLIQLNLEGRIGGTEILLWVGHDASGTPELAQLGIGHFAQTCADLLDIFEVPFS